MSDELVARLSHDLRPVPRAALPARLLLWLVGGALVAGAIMVPWIGLRPDIATAWQGGIFWLKFGYTALLALTGFLAVERLARPGGGGRRGFVAATAAFATFLAIGLLQLATAPAEATRSLLVGDTSLVCPVYIVTLSLPIFIATVLAMRRLAPTSLTLAGLAAGLLSGGAGAWVYAFHCGENGLAFLAIWYTLGVAVMALLGALTGRWLLRW